jgi:hypothetical protein
MEQVARLEPTGVRKIDMDNKIPLLRGGASVVRPQGGVIHAQRTHPYTPLKRGIAQPAASF